ncbi:hypothetical protein JOC34_004078 [Virgibacillus halotolerans]|nr:hypothetical protein [Virgibacillus halotolerans]
MDMGTALTLMISFGMLIAFIMSDSNIRKISLSPSP